MLKELDRLELDASGAEAEGYHHAELFVLQPPGEVLPAPLEALVPAIVTELPLLDTTTGDLFLGET